MNVSFDDIRHSWRGLLRRPGFLVLAAMTLALGIGASVTVIGLIDRVLLQPLPYPEPERLHAAGLVQSGWYTTITPQEYRAIEGVSGVAALGVLSATPMPMNIAADGEPELAQAYRADAGFLRALAMPMQLGRGFASDEDRANGAPAVILSHGLWQRRFGGDRQVIGRSLMIEGTATPIIGVLPRDLRLTSPFDLMVPAALPVNTRDNGRNYLAVVRLADGIDAHGVSAQVEQRIRGVYIGTPSESFYAHSTLGLHSLATVLGLQARPILRLFLASALCVLALAAVNLANLMLLRSLGHGHVAAVRRALGASNLRLALPMLAEGLLIGVIGAAVGLLLAHVGLHLVAQHIPGHWLGGELNRSLSIFAWLFALSAAVLVSVLAAGLGLWRSKSGEGVRELVAGARSGPSLRSGRLARGLVVAQVALAALLLTGAGLFARSLQEAANVDLGYRTEGLLGFEIAPIRGQYPHAADVKDMSRRVVERLSAMPGVRSAAAGTNLPIGEPLNYVVQVPGSEMFSVEFRGITPGFLDSFGIARIAGRDIGPNDVAGGVGAALVNAAFVRAHLDATQSGSASTDYGQVLERTLLLPAGGETMPLRIVGVVADTRQHGPEVSAPPMLYLPLAQIPDDLVGLLREFAPLRFAVRVDGDPSAYAQAVRAVVAEVAPGQAIAHLQPLSNLLHASTRGTRLNLMLVGVFASLSVLLAAIGLYCVMAVATAARRQEFGVRMALGSRAWSLMRLVLADGLRFVVVGLVVGLAAALALSRVAQGYFANISTSDPMAYAWVGLIVVLVAALACLAPAVRAARVSPMRALRNE